MVNWQEAGKTWPQPHPHAVRLLRGLVWGQHYRHSNPQCEGGMPGSFELREDIGPDHLQAVEDWLRVEGYAYRFRQKRRRVWTRPDRPVEGLRPDGIDEEENPNEYPSGATINVSMGDMIEKTFPEPRNECKLQGSSSSLNLGRRSIQPGTGSGTRSGGSTRNPWPPEPPKPPGAEPQPPAPNGPVAVTTPATPPLAISSKSPSRPRPSPVSCT